MARILLGVTGGIAAYKALELARLADAAGHSLRVVQTPASERFVGRASFAALTGAPVLGDEHEHDPARGAFPGQPAPAHEPLTHLELVRNAELYVIAPASANTIAKLAHGFADNLLTSAALACTCPMIVAPAMNDAMYEHAATQRNLELLRERGVSIVGPATGRLASKGEAGIGRLAEPVDLLAACERLLHEASRRRSAAGASGGGAGGAGWRGLRVLVSAGGTREPIDAVRFIGNRSSGRMGLALAAAAQARGASVTLLAANVALPSAPGLRRIDVASAAELQEACEREGESADVVIMAAAVADFRPAHPAAGKLKKRERERLRLELEPTPDVLAGLAARRGPAQTLVGFAAEHGPDALQEARRKLDEKGIDAIVLNDVSRADIGFDAERNEVWVLTRAGEEHLPRARKPEIAERILDAVERLRAPGPRLPRATTAPTVR
jgi:phosphopantothenoylcysteine decarboxylase/phosphopantothenate--cysteine ligase